MKIENIIVSPFGLYTSYAYFKYGQIIGQGVANGHEIGEKDN